MFLNFWINEKIEKNSFQVFSLAFLNSHTTKLHDTFLDKIIKSKGQNSYFWKPIKKKLNTLREIFFQQKNFAYFLGFSSTPEISKIDSERDWISSWGLSINGG